MILFCFAITAYTLFYYSYVPRIGFERVVHLQFDSLPPECYSSDVAARSSSLAATCATTSQPWGAVSLAPDVVSQQRYDIAVVLDLPRTRTNTEAGNFMLDVRLLAPEEKGVASAAAADPVDALKSGLTLSSNAENDRVLAHSRRPAILTYYSKEVELAQKASQLHWYLLGWRQEAETLRVNMFESVEFAKGRRNVPSTLRLEIQTAERRQMQVYDAKVVFRARFGGLRWLMYNLSLIHI